MKMYEVGGYVRDEILGMRSKDIDFSVVMDDFDIFLPGEPYLAMVTHLEQMGVKIIRDKEGVPVGADFVTARGIAPKDFPQHPGRALDFVLARKEGEYSDGRRPDSVEVGTLMDDLARRDFTMNAIAKDMDGSYIDPFNGRDDIADGIIRAVGNPVERLAEDALRALRALRFSVTKTVRFPCYDKQFEIEESLAAAMESNEVIDAVLNNISEERIAVELSKMFRYDTRLSLYALEEFPLLRDAVFSGSVSLDATMKQKGRGK